MQIQGRHFIITGGASGLGAATSEYLIKQGAEITLIDMNQDAGLQQVQKLGKQAQFYQIDITSEHEVADYFHQLDIEGKHIHGLVNCAGIAPSSKLVGKNGLHDLGLFQKTLEINITGTFNMMRFAVERMLKNEPNVSDDDRGIIVNTASIAAFDGQIGQAAYAASKAAVVGMTLPLARELAQHAIRIMTIAPGIMETPMVKGFPQSVQDALGAMVPYPSRLGKSSEFAALVAHIIENTYLNGEVIRLDGAVRLAAK